MASPAHSSDYGHSTSATPDSGETHKFLAMFSPGALSRIRGVISVLIDIGRLIDKGMALWHHYGVPVLRHS